MSDGATNIEKLVKEGRYLEARSKAEDLLGSSEDLRLKQLLALSMAKSGAPKTAMDFLEPVHHQHPEDAETSGILGSIYKELFKETKNSKYATLSRDTYLKNFQLTGNYYPGINAASMSVIAGSASKGKEIAKEVISKLNDATEDPWELATLGEANLLLKEKTKAVEWYVKCRQRIGSDWGKVSSIYNQLWLLNHYIPVSSQVLNIFSPPGVAAFIGHMLDHPFRQISRFPESIENEVKDAISSAIKSINAKIGYCSLACGGDILFAEAMMESGGELNLFIPFHESDFLETSVKFAGQRWIDRFRKLVDQFQVRYITHENYLCSDDLFSFQSKVIFGAALHRSQKLHATTHLISLFSDADSKAKEGGTKDTLILWPFPEKRININPMNFVNETNKNSLAEIAVIPKKVFPEKNPLRHVRYLLSLKLNDSHAHDYHERFNYHVTKKINELNEVPRATGENEVVFAFLNAIDAASAGWNCLAKFTGIPSLSLSMCLHAGPVIADHEKNSVAGLNVSVAKGIHRFSLPGKVYASFQFASALILESDKYVIEHAGLIDVNNEKLELYQLNRHSDAFDL